MKITPEVEQVLTDYALVKERYADLSHDSVCDILDMAYRADHKVFPCYDGDHEDSERQKAKREER